ncbi:MAG: hypothetical protein GY910_20060 [bacterium]|nr:hypothetical protein [Deltaproteobacteria bacterium]MCP4907278.1 hypothetical protein [bacterium]
MDAKQVEVKEEIPARRKLGASDAKQIAIGSSTVYVAKGKKLDVFDMKTAPLAEVVEKMLGPTGNLRAPTMRVGRTTVVGFSEETFDSVLG